MAFGLPTDKEPPFVLDFGAMHDVYPGSEYLEKLIEMAPSTVFRSFGLGCACQALGGFLCGVPSDPKRAQRTWSGANQGSFIIVVDLNRFFPIEQFKAEMDDYARQINQMEPLKGFDKSVMAGAIESKNEQKRLLEGIPVSSEHAEVLRNLSTEYNVPFFF